MLATGPKPSHCNCIGNLAGGDIDDRKTQEHPVHHVRPVALGLHSEGPGHRPVLFDMQNDPNEFIDLGGDPEYDDVIEMMYERLGRWARRMSQRTTRSDDDIRNMRGRSRRRGILVGLYDGSEVEDELADHIKNRRVSNYLDKFEG